MMNHKTNRLVFIVSIHLCFLGAPLSTGWADGAEIVGCDLVHDGSISPPGFRINVRVLGQPNEGAVTLRARGFASLMTSTDSTREVLPIKSENEEHSDKAGNFVLEEALRPNGISFHLLVVPYAALQLPQGLHAIWFQVGLSHEGKPIDVVMTNTVDVQISNQTRRSMRRARKVAEIRQREMRTSVFLGEPSTVTHIKSLHGATDHKLVKKDAIKTETRVTAKIVSEEVKVTIAGGFERQHVEARTPDLSPDSSQRELDIESVDGPWTTLKEVVADDKRIVLFATNRVAKLIDWPRKGKEAAPDITKIKPQQRLSKEIRYGLCRVNLPVERAKSDNVKIWRVFHAPDPVKDYTIESATYLATQDWLGQVREGDVLLYVHGFRNKFSDAVLRAAQLRYDLDFPGPVVAFCWPSDSTLDVEGYQKTHALADASIGALAEVIRLLTDTPPGNAKRQVHIIAHSMGNRVTLGAVHRLCQKGLLAKDNKRLGQVVLAAPDVGLLRFHQQVPYTIKASENTTFYFCETDVALAFSQKINYYEPAGRVPYLLPGLDSVNAKGAGTSFLSHSYYATSRLLLADIKLLMLSNAEPENRKPPLAAKHELFGQFYWTFGKQEKLTELQ